MVGVQKPGFEFVFDPSVCETCPGRCCSGASGNVWVTHQEIQQICLFLHINFIDCMGRYLRRVENRISLQERGGADGLECIFFNTTGKKCSIYTVRPSGCRTYPFWEHFKTHPEQLFQECPGVKERKKEENIRKSCR
jgi:Fe-S-cluster containining protein